jgi:hypothetical protein
MAGVRCGHLLTAAVPWIISGRDTRTLGWHHASMLGGEDGQWLTQPCFVVAHGVAPPPKRRPLLTESSLAALYPAGVARPTPLGQAGCAGCCRGKDDPRFATDNGSASPRKRRRVLFTAQHFCETVAGYRQLHTATSSPPRREGKAVQSGHG